MAPCERSFCVVHWSNLDPAALAGPGDAGRLLADNVHGCVCEIVAREGPWLVVRHGEREYRIDPGRTMPVSNVEFAVGDVVLFRNMLALIVEAIWHYTRAEPFYFLAFGGRKKSRRVFSEELARVPSDDQVSGGSESF